MKRLCGYCRRRRVVSRMECGDEFLVRAGRSGWRCKDSEDCHEHSMGRGRG